MSEAPVSYLVRNQTVTPIAFDEQFYLNWRASLLAQVDEIERVLAEYFDKNLVRTKDLRKRYRNQGS